MYRVERKKSLFVVIIDEFDLMEIYVKIIAAKLILTLNFKFSLYSTHHEGKTFPRNHKSPNVNLT